MDDYHNIVFPLHPLTPCAAPLRPRRRKSRARTRKSRARSSNHVHVVISAEYDPRRLMSDLKSRASRDLTLAGFDDANRRRWTRHGSTRHLFREEAIEAAIRYTLDEQGERKAWFAKVHENEKAPRPNEACTNEPRTNEPRTE